MALADLFMPIIGPDTEMGRKLAVIHKLEHEIADHEHAVLTGPFGPLYCTCPPWRTRRGQQPDPQICTYHHAVIAEHLYPLAERRCRHGDG